MSHKFNREEDGGVKGSAYCMYFYFLKSYTDSYSTSQYPYLFVQPYVEDNVIFDENNISKLEIRYSASYGDVNTVSTYTNSSSIKRMLNNHGQFKCMKYGFPYLVSSKTELNANYLTPLNSRIINGKYKKNTKLEYFPTREFFVGFTIPIKYSRIYENKTLNFKYLTVSSYGNWYANSEYTYSNTFIGSYSIPNIISSQPTDFSVIALRSTTNLIIDFGNNNQEVPEPFYNWLLQNFDKLYENTYTIKSVTGSTLTILTEAPPMTSATLSAVGNAKYLTLKGENDTNYTMEWTSETPQGKIFAGLATSKGGSIVIPVGETSTINLTESTDLYEVWQTYRPPTTTFEIKTYNYSGETSRVDKTDYLTPVSTISGVLRGEASLLNFNVLIQSDTVPNFNYCYIDKFKRYYYVTEPVSVRQNLWEMTMQVDALMTYKDSLLKCEGYIDRNEYIQNKMIIDNNRAIMQGADFEEDTITNELFGSGTFALSGLRIGTKELS